MRLPARLKEGYYPTPARVVDMIATYLRPQITEPMLWIDPCCGEGLALSQLSNLIGHKRVLHGVESNEYRAGQSKTRLHEVMHADSASANMKYPHKSYGLIWFNPPYDFTRLRFGDREGDKRDSETFFKMIVNRARVLTNDGIFIGILPVTDIKYLVDPMWRFFTGPQGDTDDERSYPLIFRFPDPEYDEFGQYVIFGRQRKRVLSSIPKDMADEVIAAIDNDEVPTLTHALDPLFTIPATPDAENLHMTTTVYDPKHGAEIARTRGWGARPAFQERFWPGDDPAIHPILGLLPSHTAMLIASGLYRDGVAFDATPEGGEKLAIKGRTRRITQVISQEHDDATGVTKTVSRESFITEVLTINAFGEAKLLKVSDTMQE